jgi:hypothetical protein
MTGETDAVEGLEEEACPKTLTACRKNVSKMKTMVSKMKPTVLKIDTDAPGMTLDT